MKSHMHNISNATFGLIQSQCAIRTLRLVSRYIKGHQRDGRRSHERLLGTNRDHIRLTSLSQIAKQIHDGITSEICTLPIQYLESGYIDSPNMYIRMHNSDSKRIYNVVSLLMNDKFLIRQNHYKQVIKHLSVLLCASNRACYFIFFFLSPQQLLFF